MEQLVDKQTERQEHGWTDRWIVGMDYYLSEKTPLHSTTHIQTLR